MRVIAVGDDDQNIYEFRGASAKYMAQFIKEKKAAKRELIINFRSKNNLVEFTNQFVKRIRHRLKETPIIAKDNENGNIKLVRYQSGNLIVPLVNDILDTGLSGNTCVLTKTNDEALQITGLLLNNRMKAKLIQTNDGFSLYHLAEVRYFLSQLKLGEGIYRIADEVWANAQRDLSNRFGQSNKLEICKNLIKAFEVANPKVKYKSD